MDDNLQKIILQDLKVELTDKFNKNFSAGGFFGNRWKPKKDGSASHLIKSGALRRSIQSRIEGGAIVFTSSKPYAEVHNEGGKAGRGKGFTMPQRQFIGEYPGMEKTVERIVQHAVEEELKNIEQKFN